MKERYYEFLRQQMNRLYEIPVEQFDLFFDLIRTQTVCGGDYFVQAGQMTTDFGFISKGIFRFYYMDKHGVEYVKSFCVEGDFIASYSALLRSEPSIIFIQALEDSELLLLPYADFVQLQAQHPCWAHVSRRFTEELYIKKEDRERQFLLEDAESRYRKFLASYPNIEKRVKQYDIASFLGVTPVTLSRIRRKMSRC